MNQRTKNSEENPKELRRKRVDKLLKIVRKCYADPDFSIFIRDDVGVLLHEIDRLEKENAELRLAKENAKLKGMILRGEIKPGINPGDKGFAAGDENDVTYGG